MQARLCKLHARRCISSKYGGLPSVVVGKRKFTNSAKWRDFSASDADYSPERIRNIGIIAHIDAGKTTTTERMLYYSGYTKRLGNVDDGSTVTDFLPMERARGITIQSAAITFHWPLPMGSKFRPYTINLIDTPGHADFTFEVLRSLRVLDGAVCILDGVAGVEAQTEKVWGQARNYGIPSIFFVNKLDRDGAAFGKTVRDIAAKLQIWPAVCQIPWYKNGTGPLQGVVDIVKLQALKWGRGGDGTRIDAQPIKQLESLEPNLVEDGRRARKALVDVLSEHDDLMVEAFIESEDDYMAISPEKIIASIRRCLLSEQVSLAPVFAGASLKNIGVQPLLDAVTVLLPTPKETPDPMFTAGDVSGGLRELICGNTSLVLGLPSKAPTPKTKKSQHPKINIHNLEACALAFKVVYDRHKGVLVYVRVYHGSLHRNAVLFNTNLHTCEKPLRVLRIYASDAIDVPAIRADEIGVIVGLKYARTGDTLISYRGMNPQTSPPAPLDNFQLRPINPPPPVFFAGVEPFSQAEEKRTDELLQILLREDPSLHLSVNEDSGQKLLSGMGELHLEIAGNRLIQDLKAKATMGKIEVGYRECPTASGPVKTSIFERQLVGKYGKAGCESTVTVLDEDYGQGEDRILQDGNLVEVVIGKGTAEGDQHHGSLPGPLSRDQLQDALRSGARAALARGPAFTYQVHGARVRLTFDPSKHHFGNDTNLQALTSAARKATQAAMKASHEAGPFAMAEPVMNVTINVDDENLGAVLKDLNSSRDGQVLSYDDENVNTVFGHSGLGKDTPTIDLRKVYVPPDPFEAPFDTEPKANPAVSVNRSRAINARVPLRAMVGYLPHLRSLTAGRGSFVMGVDRFQKMSSHTQKAVLKELRGL